MIMAETLAVHLKGCGRAAQLTAPSVHTVACRFFRKEYKILSLD